MVNDPVAVVSVIILVFIVLMVVFGLGEYLDDKHREHVRLQKSDSFLPAKKLKDN